MSRTLTLPLFFLASLWFCQAHALDAVTLQLKWHHQFQFAGYYAAKELGYYKEVGLDVTIKPATNDQNPISNVLNGGAQYGVGSKDLLLLRQRGEPVVALAVIFQHSPYVLLALKKKNIESVQDLVGKRIMFDPFAQEIIAYLRAVGISMDSIVKVSSNDYDAKDLLSGKIDAYAGYSTNDPYYLDKAGVPYLSFSPRSVGIDFYGDNLFTTEAAAGENSDETAEVFATNRAHDASGIVMPADGHPREVRATQLAVWDATTLTRLVGDNRAMHTRLLDKFLINGQEQVTAISVAAEADDIGIAADVAHKLKSAARAVGALRLGELCEKMETAARSCDSAACSALVEPLSEAFGATAEAIGSRPL
jgi:ABC-type nitrate/sulfonate/bicarbonate transport system substrate-binding protein/HPt (histidine-containing phosphotransfer) domain-containing protein